MHKTVLLAHNYYQTWGGEDSVFEAEAALLEAHGHTVLRYELHNDGIVDMTRPALARLTLWNSRSARELRQLCRDIRPDLVHFHNTFPLLSPSAYYAARGEGVAVVQTLHNYRLLCVEGQFLRNGRTCEDCLEHALPWPGVVHSCYRGSRAASTVLASMLSLHRLLGTWTRTVDRYVVLTEFARAKFIEGGLPAAKIRVKPNFVHPDPGIGTHEQDFALFVGRLNQQKGVNVLLDAWKRLHGRVPLKIVGEGPLAGAVAEAARSLIAVEWLGHRSAPEVLDLMKRSRALIFPSISYEGFPLVIGEAFATGLPVITSGFGAMASLVSDGKSGLLFQPGSPEDLASKVGAVWSRTELLAELGRCARREYERRYTAPRNHALLMNIYDEAIMECRGRDEVGARTAAAMAFR